MSTPNHLPSSKLDMFNISSWNLESFIVENNNNFFNGCFGALDGTHIHVRCKKEETERFRNRKGFISTNMMLLCDFDMNILYAYIGVEGSAHDGFVFNCSNLVSILNRLPSNAYILADAGYRISSRILTPYRSTRYHLQEFSDTNQPRNYKELFNLRHSKKRNVIERLIGVLKKRWSILRTCNDSLNKEFINASILSCLILNNLLLQRNDLNYDNTIQVEGDLLDEINFFETFSTTPNDLESKEWRDEIALEMWNNYLR